MLNIVKTKKASIYRGFFKMLSKQQGLANSLLYIFNFFQSIKK